MKAERVFIPEAAPDKTFTECPFCLAEIQGLLKREGVIVFTPEELKEFMIEYGLSPYKVEQHLKSKGSL